MFKSPEYSLMEGVNFEDASTIYNSDATTVCSSPSSQRHLNYDRERSHEVESGDEIIISSVKSLLICCVCKCFPRPRVNQLAFFICKYKHHLLCISCMRITKNELYCKGCDAITEEWKNPRENPFLNKLYQDIVVHYTFECLRHCGNLLKGDEVIPHDKVCTYGRRMYCPHDNLEIVLFKHHINGHLPHLITHFPIEYIPRTWSITFNWEYAKSLGSDHIPVHILYLESENNYTTKTHLGTLNYYNPLAALVKFNVERKINNNVNTVCNIQIQWLENQPIDTEACGTPRFRVEETKQYLNEIHNFRFYLKPTYQIEPPPSSQNVNFLHSTTSSMVGHPRSPHPLPTSPSSSVSPRTKLRRDRHVRRRLHQVTPNIPIPIPSTSTLALVPNNPFFPPPPPPTPLLSSSSSPQHQTTAPTHENESVYIQYFDDINVSELIDDIYFPCRRCGSINEKHTHFDITLEGTY